MQARLQAAEDEIEKNNLDKAKIQEEVDANHQAYLLKIERVDDKLRDIDAAKQQVLDVMGPKFEELRMTAESIIRDAQKKFEDHGNQIGGLMKEAGSKFSEQEENQAELNKKLEALFAMSHQRLSELSDSIGKVSGGGHSDHKKIGLLPDKMMIPKIYDHDILQWNKWKDSVMKYFDESKEGIKKVMEEVAQLKEPVTADALRTAARNYPQVLSSVEQWKHLYRALERLTDGEASKVLSTVKDENGFEAWRQLHLRFEP